MVDESKLRLMHWKQKYEEAIRQKKVALRVAVVLAGSNVGTLLAMAYMAWALSSR